MAHELEELEEDAIVAQQTNAHLPQKRARVAREARSIVISEPPAPGSVPYDAGHSEATVVVRDRRSLSAARKRILSQRPSARRNGSLIWAGLAVAAFAAGGLLAFLSFRGMGTRSLDLSQSNAEPALQRAQLGVAAARRTEVVKARDEAVPRQVRLEELPLERPKRR